jgi:hypothetical protein
MAMLQAQASSMLMQGAAGLTLLEAQGEYIRASSTHYCCL